MNYYSSWYLINKRIERYNKHLVSEFIPKYKTIFPVKVLSAAEYKLLKKEGK